MTTDKTMNGAKKSQPGLPPTSSERCAVLLRQLADAAEAGDIHAVAVVFAVGPEQGGKAVVPGGLPCTLSSACLDLANELARKPFERVPRQPVEAEKPKAPGLII